MCDCLGLHTYVRRVVWLCQLNLGINVPRSSSNEHKLIIEAHNLPFRYKTITPTSMTWGYSGYFIWLCWFMYELIWNKCWSVNFKWRVVVYGMVMPICQLPCQLEWINVIVWMLMVYVCCIFVISNIKNKGVDLCVIWVVLILWC